MDAYAPPYSSLDPSQSSRSDGLSPRAHAAPASMTSVKEVIDGKERQVYVISDDDDDDTPPASPLRNPPVVAAARHSGKRKASAPWSGSDEASAKRQRHDANTAVLDQLAASLNANGMRQAYAEQPAYTDPGEAYAYANALPAPYAVPSPVYPEMYAAGSQNLSFAPAQDNAMLLARANKVDPYYASAKPRPSYYDTRPVEPWASTAQVDAPEALMVDDKDGHFIVREGDQITPRYQIRGMLGQGTFGKVVNCYDRKLRRCVAIKVIRAVQKYRDASQIEIRVLQCLRQNDPLNEYQCVQLLETFDFRNHVCIVSDLLDRSVFDFLKDNHFQPFPCRNIWYFAKQLFKSVAFLHGLSLIHTDLKPENVLLVDASYDVVATSRRANARKKRVLRNADIRLIDFGSATFNDEYHSGVVSTRHYRAPEIILGMGWSYPCDAWSLGCILVEFFTGDALFQTHDNLEHLAMMEMVLGALPDDYRRKAETYKPEYFRNGHLDYPKPETSKQSRRYVQNMKRLQDIVAAPAAYAKHNQAFVSLLRRLLDFDPAKRITMQEALMHPYFDLQPNEIPP